MRAMAETRIDLDQLARNIKLVQANLPPQIELLFAVKRDAYGHGLVEVARVAEREGVDRLGVADILEVERLRRAGIELPILVMGLSRREDIADLLSLGASISIADIDFAAKLDREAHAQHMRATVHVIVETGLGRFGIFPEEVVPFFRELGRFSHLYVEGVFSHLSVPESLDPVERAYTLEQIAKLTGALVRLDEEGMLPPLRHVGCAPCLLTYPETTSGYYNMVRIGAILYGYPEVPVGGTWAEEITPIASITSNIIDLRELPAGSYISYDRTYQTDSVRRIAVVPLGFGSGLHRGLSNCGMMIVRGQRAPIVGKICLDHTMIDVTGMGVALGDAVEVIGPRLTADEQGAMAGIGLNDVLIPLCKQVSRLYLSNT